MLRTKTPNKAQIPGSKSGSLGLLKRAVTKVLKSTPEPEAEQISRGPGFKPSHTIKHARNINSQLARGNSFTQSVINSSTSSSSNIFNLFSPVAQCGSNFNQVVFAFQMPSNISGQNDQRQCFVNINHFHQRQVTFNTGNTAAPEKPQPAAPPGEDSISN